MKNKETKNIKDAFDLFKWALDSKSYPENIEYLLDLSIKESKDHDRFRDKNYCERGISILTESKYFAVLRLYEYLTTDNMPRPVDYLHIHCSCFAAYALAHTQQKALVAAISKNPALFLTVAAYDYCSLITPKDVNHRSGFKPSPA